MNRLNRFMVLSALLAALVVMAAACGGTTTSKSDGRSGSESSARSERNAASAPDPSTCSNEYGSGEYRMSIRNGTPWNLRLEATEWICYDWQGATATPAEFDGVVLGPGQTVTKNVLASPGTSRGDRSAGWFTLRISGDDGSTAEFRVGDVYSSGNSEIRLDSSGCDAYVNRPFAGRTMFAISHCFTSKHPTLYLSDTRSIF